MLHIQRRVPTGDQIALLGQARLLSGWCGVRHHVRSTHLYGVWPDFVFGNPATQVARLTSCLRLR